MEPATLKVKVPYWAKDIEHEGVLMFIAFMYRMSLQYGYDEFTVTKRDTNMIVGEQNKGVIDFLYEIAPEAKPWLRLRWTALHYNHVQLKEYKRHFSPENLATVWVEISNERQIRVWCFLLGAFRHHLLTDDVFDTRKGHTMSTTDQTLFKYKEYDSTARNE